MVEGLALAYLTSHLMEHSLDQLKRKKNNSRFGSKLQGDTLSCENILSIINDIAYIRTYIHIYLKWVLFI